MVELAGLSIHYSADSRLPLERSLRDLRPASLDYSGDLLWSVKGVLILMDTHASLA